MRSPACAGTQQLGRRKKPQTQMGAGIAADPLSPDFDPLIRLPKKTNRAVWFRRPAPPRAASGAKALRFGHRGRARYPCGPQRHSLGGQLGVPDRSPFRFALAPTCRTAFRPVMSVAHPAIAANALPRSRGRGGTFRSTVSCVRHADACASARFGHQQPCGPASKARRILRSSSLPRHKLLISLRFPASSSSAYSHEGVIESESCQSPKRVRALWITWISWSELCIAAQRRRSNT